MNVNRQEIIEAYLKGELSHSEKLSFESQLEQDPLFKSELELQKDIVNSLKNYRKAQLKERLNSIEVGSSFVNVTAIKIVSSVIISALIGYGVYYFMPSANEKDAQYSEVKNSQEIIQKPLSPVTSSKLDLVQEIQKVETGNYQKVVAPKISQKQHSASRSSDLNIKNDVVVSPNVIDTFSENQIIKTDNAIGEHSKVNTTTADKIADIQIVNEDSKSKDLKYKYLNKKLYLYGDFSQSTYELLELNSTQGKKLFLFHNGDYFHLNENQKSITPLVPIGDSLVIEELNTLKEGRL